ncbi:MAG TPA: arginase family protein [Stellaceae bacterium]|nr:arginase family protein [Stellaceae bacterium]
MSNSSMRAPSSIGDIFGAPAPRTFLGLPEATIAEGAAAAAAIIGAPAATPYPSVGSYCAGAPAAIRAGIANWSGALHHMDFDLGGKMIPDGVRVVDCGDLPYAEDDAEGNRRRITGAVRTLLDGGAVPIVLGGDDSIPIPLFQAFEGRGRYAVLQIDAHIDWRDEVQGIRLGLSSTMRRASEMPWIERIVQVGARGTGSARETDYRDAVAAGVSFFMANVVASSGIDPILEAIPQGADVLITVDVDGLDPSIMPGVIGPAPGGLLYWQAASLIQGIARKARIAAFDIVEFVPERDIQQTGALTAARLVANAIGLIARQKG